MFLGSGSFDFMHKINASRVQQILEPLLQRLVCGQSQPSILDVKLKYIARLATLCFRLSNQHKLNTHLKNKFFQFIVAPE